MKIIILVKLFPRWRSELGLIPELDGVWLRKVFQIQNLN